MKEWSDEELDKLFRKSAEEFEPTYEPDDWKELHDRLNDDGYATEGGWFGPTRRWTIALVLLMILGGVSVYFERHHVEDKRATILVPSNTGSPGSSAQQNKSEGSENELFSEPIPNSESAASHKTDHDDRPISNTPLASALNGPKAGSRPMKIKELPRNPVSVSGVRKSTDPRNWGRGDGAVLLPTDKPARKTGDRVINLSNHKPEFIVDRSEEEGNEVDKDQVVRQTVDTASEPPGAVWREKWMVMEKLEHRAGGIQKNAGPLLPEVAIREVSDSTSIVEPMLPRAPRWAVRIGISPDLSAVNMKMKNFSRPAPAASVLVEYNLSRKWAVQTGVIRSLKTYSAQAGDYEWPANWYQKQMPVSVDGTCQVFELPLNVRYDISQRQKTRWFAGAGVSSYKMQNEKYVYHYKTYDPNIRWWKWEGKTGWYFLSHANASVGYEHRLTERLSLMAEPYVRIPLRKVGFGKVNLFSTGVWFSVRYTPTFIK